MLTIKEGGRDHEPMPAGVHIGICYSVVDLGTHHNLKYDKFSRRLCFIWEIPSLRIEYERDGKALEGPRVISYVCNATLGSEGKPSKLRAMLNSWRGKKMTGDELRGFDLGRLLGVPAQLQIVHNVVGDKTYANVETVLALPSGVEVPEPENPQVKYEIEEDEIPESLPIWIQKKIQESREWQERHPSINGGVIEKVQDTFLSTTAPAASAAQGADDLPF